MLNQDDDFSFKKIIEFVKACRRDGLNQDDDFSFKKIIEFVKACRCDGVDDNSIYYVLINSGFYNVYQVRHIMRWSGMTSKDNA